MVDPMGLTMNNRAPLLFCYLRETRATGRRFRAGRFDCALFAAEWVKRCSGKDLAAQWRGTYRRLDQGRDQLAMAGFSSLDDLAAHHLVEIDGWSQAQVGDIAAIQEAGEIALGIFGGPQIHVLSLDGLDYVNPANAYRVFRP
ncbi:hypothetical protein [Pseudophaeobacter sp.]|uniref:DUF6950 family protein n=2 Tax=Pseudophaeobacter sp. TaxID=1971739 RepID=UPI003296CA08